MTARRLLQAARRRAGKSQRQLAAAAGIPQATIARIESGAVDPRFGTLVRLLRACGYDVESTPLLGQGIDRTHIQTLLDLTPAERLSHAASGAAVLAVLDDVGRQLRTRPRVGVTSPDSPGSA